MTSLLRHQRNKYPNCFPLKNHLTFNQFEEFADVPPELNWFLSADTPQGECLWCWRTGLSRTAGERKNGGQKEGRKGFLFR